MHYSVLIIDDEAELSEYTARYFNMSGVSAAYVLDQASALEFFQENTCSLVLLDINLGEDSGFELCQIIRRTMNLPIFFISARSSEDDMLLALTIGGDDYICKPYSLSVLLAKVKVQLKRLEAVKQLSGTKEVPTENFTVDPATMSCTVEGRVVNLKSKEFALLSCLYEHRNTIVTKEKLFDEVWGDSFYSDSTLNVHIRRLREKIEEDPNEPKFIKTIWGTGYILETN